MKTAQDANGTAPTQADIDEMLDALLYETPLADRVAKEIESQYSEACDKVEAAQGVLDAAHRERDFYSAKIRRLHAHYFTESDETSRVLAEKLTDAPLLELLRKCKQAPWAKYKRDGAEDAKIELALQVGWPQFGVGWPQFGGAGSGDRAAGGHDNPPRVWIHGADKPTFQGKALIAEARRLLQIPQPARKVVTGGQGKLKGEPADELGITYAMVRDASVVQKLAEHRGDKPIVVKPISLDGRLWVSAGGEIVHGDAAYDLAPLYDLAEFKSKFSGKFKSRMRPGDPKTDTERDEFYTGVTVSNLGKKFAIGPSEEERTLLLRAIDKPAPAAAKRSPKPAPKKKPAKGGGGGPAPTSKATKPADDELDEDGDDDQDAAGVEDPRTRPSLAAAADRALGRSVGGKVVGDPSAWVGMIGGKTPQRIDWPLSADGKSVMVLLVWQANYEGDWRAQVASANVEAATFPKAPFTTEYCTSHNNALYLATREVLDWLHTIAGTEWGDEAWERAEAFKSRLDFNPRGSGAKRKGPDAPGQWDPAVAAAAAKHAMANGDPAPISRGLIVAQQAAAEEYSAAEVAKLLKDPRVNAAGVFPNPTRHRVAVPEQLGEFIVLTMQANDGTWRSGYDVYWTNPKLGSARVPVAVTDRSSPTERVAQAHGAAEISVYLTKLPRELGRLINDVDRQQIKRVADALNRYVRELTQEAEPARAEAKELGFRPQTLGQWMATFRGCLGPDVAYDPADPRLQKWFEQELRPSDAARMFVDQQGAAAHHTSLKAAKASASDLAIPTPREAGQKQTFRQWASSVRASLNGRKSGIDVTLIEAEGDAEIIGYYRGGFPASKAAGLIVARAATEGIAKLAGVAAKPKPNGKHADPAAQAVGFMAHAGSATHAAGGLVH